MALGPNAALYILRGKKARPGGCLKLVSPPQLRQLLQPMPTRTGKPLAQQRGGRESLRPFLRGGREVRGPLCSCAEAAHARQPSIGEGARAWPGILRSVIGEGGRANVPVGRPRTQTWYPIQNRPRLEPLVGAVCYLLPVDRDRRHEDLLLLLELYEFAVQAGDLGHHRRREHCRERIRRARGGRHSRMPADGAV